MTTELVRFVTGIFERLVELALIDPQCRQQLRELAHWILAHTEDGDARAQRQDNVLAGQDGAGRIAGQANLPGYSEAQTAQTVADESLVIEGDGGASNTIDSASRTTEAASEPRKASRTRWVPFHELTFGRNASPGESSASGELVATERPAPHGELDFALVDRRCSLKAEAARWVANRYRRSEAEVDEADEQMERDLIARARPFPQCYLWMLHEQCRDPQEAAAYETLAGCYQALATAARLWQSVEADADVSRSDLEQTLQFLAEAQSALRVAVEVMGQEIPDPDQVQVYYWLRGTTAREQIFLPRFMRWEDAADPAGWKALIERMEMHAQHVQQARERARQQRKLLSKIRHKASLIAGGQSTAEDMQKLIAAVDEVIQLGLAPSNRQLREALLPALDELPTGDDTPQNYQLVLRSIQQYLEATHDELPGTVERPSPELEEAARLLEGRSLVLIGGDRRPQRARALQEALRLRELIWITTRDHEPLEMFEPYVAREDVAAVVLAIRWASHSYGEVRAFCERYAKPLVRLPGGYNPNQVAAQIVAQCSKRLQAG
jgi:hypothetical protein